MSLYVIGSSLTLDDLCQLQSLLSHEHRKREKYTVDHYHLHNHPVHHHHHELQFHHFMTPAVAKREQERLQVALEHLKVLKEQYRRQRAIQIQAYLDNFRRQQLIRAVLEEEEERYYRQCLSAALEKRRVNAIFNQYLLQRQFQQQRIKEERLSQNKAAASVAILGTEQKEEQEEGYSEYHSQQLAELLKQLFDHQPIYDIDENNTEIETADVWQYVLDTLGDEKPSYQFDVPMTERQIPSLAPHLVTQDPVTAYINERERAYDELNQDPDKLPSSVEQDNFTQKGKEDKGSKREIEKDSEGEVELKDSENEQQQQTKTKENKSVETSEASDESDAESLPPLQGHVLTLQDLINKLSSEPVMVGEQYVAPEPVKKDVQYLVDQSYDKQISGYFNNRSDLEIGDEDESSPATFMPQSIITSAEPTPTIEQSVTDVNKEFSDFVDSIAAEQKQDLSSAPGDDSLPNPRISAKPEIIVQSEKDEVNSFEADDMVFQNKPKTSNHIHATQAALNNQLPLQPQNGEEPTVKTTMISAKPEHPNSVESIPLEDDNQRISANFDLATPCVDYTKKDDSIKKESIQERDPAKQHIYNQLDRIESKLCNPDLKSRWEKVLQSSLTFSKQDGGTLLLSASTEADREHLGLEDELMCIMLELDTIISEGDECIRGYRRTLVKWCESMLDQLDQHKHKEWEKTIGTKHHRHHSHKK